MYDRKEHYKMYKSGKHWVSALITTIVGVTTMVEADLHDAHADTVNNQSQSSKVATASSNANKTSVQLHSNSAAVKATSAAKQPSSQNAASATSQTMQSQASTSAATSQASQNATSTAKTTTASAVASTVTSQVAKSQATTNSAVASQANASVSTASQQTTSASAVNNDATTLLTQTSATSQNNKTSQTNTTKQASTASQANNLNSNNQSASQAESAVSNAASQATSAASQANSQTSQANNDYVQKYQDGYWYLYNAQGEMLKGFQNVYDGNLKHDKTVYYNNDGQMQYGQQHIDNHWYLFNTRSGAMETGFQTVYDGDLKRNKTVYYNQDGQMQYGQQQIDGYWYLFATPSGAMQTGWQQLPGKKVYYNAQGQMQYGQQYIDGHWYYLQPYSGMMLTGFQSVYDGDMKHDKTVYYNNDGQMQYGQQYIDGHWYLFATPSGAMQTGFQTLYDGSLKHDKTVYYADNGQMQYGQQQIDGHWYLFAEPTGAMQTGWQQLPGKKVYYNDQGQMQYGQQYIDGHWYYLQPYSGMMLTGFQTLYDGGLKHDKTVYYADNGQMQYGQQYINGHWYLFATPTGAMQTGFQNLYDGGLNQVKTVYYNQDGQMQYGWQNLDKGTYYFEAPTGQMMTGQQSINGQYYQFSAEGVLVNPQLSQYRDAVATDINNILQQQGKKTLDGNWLNKDDNYYAFSLHDVAQLVAQGDLDSSDSAIETNLQNTQLMNGVAHAYQVSITNSDLNSAAMSAANDIVNMLGNNYNWQAFGVGVAKDNANNTWHTIVVMYNNDQMSPNATATSSIKYVVDNVYKNPGINTDVENGLTAGCVDPADLRDALNSNEQSLLTGNANQTISQSTLGIIANNLGGMNQAYIGQTTYYDKWGNPYHYEYWLEGPNAAGKEWNIQNDNKNVTYGSPIVVKYSATLVYGKPTSNTTNTDNSTGVPSTSMTPQQIEAAYKTGSCNGLRYDNVVITPIKGVTNSTIRGVDVSSYIALQKAGVKFYDFNGQQVDLMQVLKDAGVNYIRIRLWVDPYDAQNQTYSGGSNDEKTGLDIAKAAAKYGMNVMLDFQYSDFWADPGKQLVPKAWGEESIDDIAKEVSQYTSKVMNDFKNAGINVGMAQVGNEITNGILGQATDRDHGGSYQGAWDMPARADAICKYLNAGLDAIRAISPTTKTVIQLETPNIDKYENIMDVMQQHNVNYDILGSSYYPCWSCDSQNGHGLGVGANTPNNLLAVEKMVAEKYHKQFVVLETSWANSVNDADGTPNSVGATNTPFQNTEAYPVGPQGQVDEIEAMYKAIVAGNGLGAFYWEPAWIPVKAGWDNWQYNDAASEQYGTGWCNSHALGYSPNNVMYYNGKPAWGGSSWDNMSMFDDNGYPLQSLKVFGGIVDNQ